jgi:hypothetical protein
MVPKTVLGTLAVSAALVATTVPAQAATGHDPVPARQGAHWLTGQLTHGLIHNDQYDFDDYGLTADTGLELAALGGHAKAVSRIAGAVAPGVASYYSSTYQGVTTTYAGSLAKAAVLAEVAHRDPASFGGHDLISLLEQRVSTAAADRGRLHDDNNSYGDANMLGQALAARALSNAASASHRTATSVVRFLLTQQCSAGYFPLEMGDASNPGATCDARKATPDTDATSYAVIQLSALAHPSRAVDTAIADARTWLRSKQKANGAWGGGTSTAAANANSTGLAGWALRGSAAARHAAVWIRKHQVRDAGVCGTRLRHDIGAVAYDSATLAAGRRDGITTTTQDQWRRTTTQALVPLTALPRATAPIKVTTRHHTVTAGQRITVRVRHAAPYSQVCVSVGGHHVKHAVNAAGRATVRITVPKGRPHRTLAAVDSDRRRDTLRLTVHRR